MTSEAQERAHSRGYLAISRWFYVWMALACAAFCFFGFLPTYIGPMAQGTFEAPPLVHLHGLSMLAWIGLFTSQTWLAATGRIRSHRRWGLLGPALATAAVLLLITALAVNMNQAEQVNPAAGMRTRAAAIFNLPAALLFGALVAMGIGFVDRPEIHKRVMLLANLVAMGPGLGRLIRVGIMNKPIFDVMTLDERMIMNTAGLLTVEIMVALAMVHDWRTRGRPHPVYMIGAVLFFVTNPSLRMSFGQSDTWQGLTLWLQHIGG